VLLSLKTDKYLLISRRNVFPSLLGASSQRLIVPAWTWRWRIFTVSTG